MKCNLELQSTEKKVAFLQGLHPEWKSVVSMVKAHEQFKSYNLSQRIGIFKSHEGEVTEDSKLIVDAGPLALVEKEEKVKNSKEKVIVDYDSNATDDEWTSKEKVLMVINPKKFFKKNFLKFRNGRSSRSESGGFRNCKGGNSYYDNNIKVMALRTTKKTKEKEKKERKLIGYYGYDCNFSTTRITLPKIVC